MCLIFTRNICLAGIAAALLATSLSFAQNVSSSSSRPDIFTSQFATVVSIDGSATVASSERAQPEPVKLWQTFPEGSVIRTSDDSEVIISGLPGSALQIDSKSQVKIIELKKSSNAGHSSFEISKGKMVYSFDALTNDSSYFKLKSPLATARAQGGSGCFDADGSFGVLSGTLLITPSKGEKKIIQAGWGGLVDRNGLSIHILSDIPDGLDRTEIALNAAYRAASRFLVGQEELDLAKWGALRGGLPEERLRNALRNERIRRRFPKR